MQALTEKKLSRKEQQEAYDMAMLGMEEEDASKEETAMLFIHSHANTAYNARQNCKEMIHGMFEEMGEDEEEYEASDESFALRKPKSLRFLMGRGQDNGDHMDALATVPSSPTKEGPNGMCVCMWCIVDCCVGNAILSHLSSCQMDPQHQANQQPQAVGRLAGSWTPHGSRSGSRGLHGGG